MCDFVHCTVVILFYLWYYEDVLTLRTYEWRRYSFKRTTYVGATHEQCQNNHILIESSW